MTAEHSLRSIRDGVWQPQIEALRALPVDSSAHRKFKKALPYVTFAGTFSRRDSGHLIKHSGLCGIDLDSLDSETTRHVMHVALDDPNCAAAFRSASGHGVRLVMRVPPVTAPQHKFVFDAAANHVRNRYGVEPDLSGSDVSRASFVSFDGGLWMNPQATVLPVKIPEVTPAGLHSGNNHCVNPRVSQVPWFVWLAREYQPYRKREDGTYETHHILLKLGKAIALRLHRERGWRVVDGVAESAAEAWLAEMRIRGLALRGSSDDYATELVCRRRGCREPCG
jgi:hypothetical protein